jgi:hypothetical protein
VHDFRVRSRLSHRKRSGSNENQTFDEAFSTADVLKSAQAEMGVNGSGRVRFQPWRVTVGETMGEREARAFNSGSCPTARGAVPVIAKLGERHARAFNSGSCPTARGAVPVIAKR